MDHDKPAHRSYNEKEIGGLIQRATELHERTTGAPERSLSLEEIQHIAAELGLPPEHVQTAALELEDRLNSDKTFSLWGGPFVIDQARVVGGTMTEEQWEHIVLELRRFTGRTGQVSEVGRAREWKHALGESDDGISFTRTQVTMRPGEGQTSVQIRKHYGAVAFWYLPVFFLAGFLSLVALNEFPNPVTLALGIGSVIGSLVVVRTLISSWAGRQKERLKRLADRLHPTLSASSSSVLANEPASGLVELPEQDESTMEKDEPERITPEARRGTRA